jgi:transcription antitermination factor NusB
MGACKLEGAIFEIDSETGKCKCKRKCLGHLDPVTGDIVPNRGKKDSSLVTVKSIGVNNLLEKVSEKIGLTESIKAAFPTDWKLILSFMFYNLREPTTMSRIRYWSQENETPFRKQISEDLVINLFQNITENSLFSFYREWRDHFDDADFFTYYVSSVPSFERRAETIRFNDLPMMLIRPETVISMTYNTKSGLPVVFDTPDRLPVNLTDIRKNESKNLWLDFNKVISTLDMDYCNEENLADLLRSNSRFLLRASPQFPLARNSIEKVRDRIMDLSNYKTIDGNSFFVMSFVNYLNGKKYFVNIYFSPDEAQKEYITRLVRGVGDHSAELDGYIAKYARGWSFSRISRTAVAIMKTAMYEILYMPDIPDSAAINEAVELAKKYEEDETVPFVNGVLGSFLRNEVPRA